MEISPCSPQMNFWLDDAHREAVSLDTKRAKESLVLRAKSSILASRVSHPASQRARRRRERDGITLVTLGGPELSHSNSLRLSMKC